MDGEAENGARAVRGVLDHLDAHSKSRPHKPFLAIYKGDRFQAWSYADLHARAALWARRLAAVPRDGTSGVAFVALGHDVDAYAAFLGALGAGLVPSLLPPPTVRQSAQAYADAHRAVARRTQPAVLVTARAFAPPLREAFADSCPVLLSDGDAPLAQAEPPPPEGADGCALLQHSSGTTGLKKGVLLTLDAVDRHVAMLARATGLGEADVVASWLPLYHDMGLMTGFLAPLTLGASVVALDPLEWVARPSTFFHAVERHRATLAWTPNFALAHAARTRAPGERFDLSSLRMLVNCSEPCRPETVERFLQAFGADGIGADRMGACYGLAEVVFAATQTTPGAAPRTLSLDAAALEDGRVAAAGSMPGARVRRLLSCGRPLPGVEVVVDAAPGRTGEICVRTPTAAAGYFGETGPDDTLSPSGWRRTGDIGLLEGGEVFVCGRAKEMLIVHGRNLYAGDLEAVVGAVPGVRPGRVAVVALDDEATGSETVGVLLEPVDPALDAAGQAALVRAVRAAVREHFDVGVGQVALAAPGSLAKSTAGKMSRADNLARLRDGAVASIELETDPLAEHPGVVRLPLQTLVETVARALDDCFGFDPARVDAGTAPDDVSGWDSLGHTVLLMRLERATGLRLDEGAAAARTAGALAARLAEAAALQRRAAA